MRILVASDLHLSERIWKHMPIEGDSEFALKQIVDQAIRLEVTSVILAGDILDRQANHSAVISILLRELSRLQHRGIKVYYNQGQHDMQDTPWLSLLPSALVTHLKGQLIELGGGWSLSGIDYSTEKDLASYLESNTARAADILVFHQTWKDLMGNVGLPQGEFSQIPGTAKLAVTGDFHTTLKQEQGDTTILSPGSTHLRSISEEQDKSVYVVWLKDKPDFCVKKQSLVSRRKFIIQVDQNPSFKELAESVEDCLGAAARYAAKYDTMPAHIAKPIFQFIIPVDLTELQKKLKDLVDDRAFIFFKPVKKSIEGDNDTFIEHTEAGERVTLMGCLNLVAPKDECPQVHEVARQLLQSEDPKRTIEDWMNKKKEIKDV